MKPNETCGPFEPLLYDYLHGLLEPDEALLVRHHVARCHHCTAELHRWRSFDSALQDVLEPEAVAVPPDLTRQIIAAVREEAAGQTAAGADPPAITGRTLAGAAIAAVLVTGATLGLLTRPVQLLLNWAANAGDAAVGTPVVWFSDSWGPLVLWTVAGLVICYAAVLGCAEFLMRSPSIAKR